MAATLQVTDRPGSDELPAIGLPSSTPGRPPATVDTGGPGTPGGDGVHTLVPTHRNRSTRHVASPGGPRLAAAPAARPRRRPAAHPRRRPVGDDARPPRRPAAPVARRAARRDAARGPDRRPRRAGRTARPATGRGEFLWFHRDLPVEVPVPFAVEVLHRDERPAGGRQAALPGDDPARPPRRRDRAGAAAPRPRPAGPVARPPARPRDGRRAARSSCAASGAGPTRRCSATGGSRKTYEAVAPHDPALRAAADGAQPDRQGARGDPAPARCRDRPTPRPTSSCWSTGRARPATGCTPADRAHPPAPAAPARARRAHPRRPLLRHRLRRAVGP